jgi:hypothetical protein
MKLPAEIEQKLFPRSFCGSGVLSADVEADETYEREAQVSFLKRIHGIHWAME